MRGSHAVVLSLLALCWSVSAVHAEDQDRRPATPEATAAEVTQAVADGASDVLAAIAARSDPDPWLVADQLCAGGDFDAARAFAEAVPQPVRKRLVAYVAAQRAEPEPAERRAQFAKMQAALSRGDAKVVLAATDNLPERSRSVVSLRAAHARALALASLRDEPKCLRQYLATGSAAAAFGWHRRAYELFESGHSVAMRIRDYARADQAGKAMVESAQALDRPQWAGLARLKWASALRRRNRIEAARSQLRQAHQAMDALGANVDAGIAALRLGNLLLREGRADEALDWFERAEQRAIAAEHVGLRGSALNNQANAHRQRGDLNRAVTTYATALATFEAANNTSNVARALSNLGSTLRELGRPEEALAHLTRTLEIRESLKAPAAIALTRNSLA